MAEVKEVHDYQDQEEQSGAGKQNETIYHFLGFKIESALRAPARVRGEQVATVSTFD